jgi:DNA-binding NtrC family response regulator
MATVRVLIVDDDPGVRQVLASMLNSAGYQTIVAGNGREALEAMSRTPCDVIITDLVMPEQEGIETIKLIREQYPRSKVIAMSGAFGGDYLRIAGYLGAHGTLTKPIRLATVLQTVQSVLER